MQKIIALALFTAVWLLTQLSFAQEVQLDSSTVDVRLPDEQAIETYANDPAFTYLQAAENPNSLSQRIFGFVINTILRILNNPLGEFFVNLILIVSVIGLVFALINQLLSGELITLFTKDKNKGFSLGINREELEQTDFEQQLELALKNNDYHAATRLVYLITLQMLAKKGLITWSLEKTNLDFLRELTGHPIKKDFSSLTKTYEYVEYGDFEINATQFDRYNLVHEEIKAALNE